MLELELERTHVWPDYSAFIVNGRICHSQNILVRRRRPAIYSRRRQTAKNFF